MAQREHVRFQNREKHGFARSLMEEEDAKKAKRETETEVKQE